MELHPGDQVVFTDLSHYDKRDLAAAVVAGGFAVGPGVSRKTRMLIAGDPEGTTAKARRARELGLPILSEDDFVSAYLNGNVTTVLDIEFPVLPWPVTLSDDAARAKRDVKVLKALIGGLREGVTLQAVFGNTVVHGPARLSKVSGEWTIGAISLGTPKAPHPELIALGLAEDPNPIPIHGASLVRIDHPRLGVFHLAGTPAPAETSKPSLLGWYLDSDFASTL